MEQFSDFLSDAWGRFAGSDTLIAAVVSVLFPLIIFATQGIRSKKVKLHYGTFWNEVLLPKKADGEAGVLKIRKIRIHNSGNKDADDLEKIFNWKPQHIEHYPHLANNEEIKPDGRYVVRASRLNAKEDFFISMVCDTGELPPIIYIRAKDAAAKVVECRPTIWFSVYIRCFIGASMVLGWFTMVYLLVVLLGWILFGRYPSI